MIHVAHSMSVWSIARQRRASTAAGPVPMPSLVRASGCAGYDIADGYLWQDLIADYGNMTHQQRQLLSTGDALQSRALLEHSN